MVKASRYSHYRINLIGERVGKASPDDRAPNRGMSNDNHQSGQGYGQETKRGASGSRYRIAALDVAGNHRRGTRL
jgi:hypothetical protein